MQVFNFTFLIFIAVVWTSCQTNMQKKLRQNQTYIQAEQKVETIKPMKEGFWISLETGQVIEILENGNLILNRFGSLAPQEIQANQFGLIFQNEGAIQITFELFNKLVFHKPVKIFDKDLNGQWFSYTNEGNYENSQLLTYQSDGYMFESVELFHDDQSYSQYSEFLPYRFSHGFVFEDYFVDGESYWYFLVESTNEHKTYIDEDGFTWSEEKYTGQPHVMIPSGYFNESF